MPSKTVRGENREGTHDLIGWKVKTEPSRIIGKCQYITFVCSLFVRIDPI
jgi:hypothetical protein